jgi:hypothetical protein
MARVLARSPRVRFVDDTEALTVRAKFTVLKSGNVVGEVVFAAPRAQASSRRLVGRSCAQAADAVAIIVAVTLDPDSVNAVATSEKEPMPERSRALGKDESASAAPPVAERPAAKRKSEMGELTNEPEKDAMLPGRSSPAPPVVARPRFGAQLAAVSVWGPAPAVMPGLAVYAMVGLDREAVWSPALVAGVAHARSTSFEVEGGRASFSLDSVSLDVCTFRFQFSSLELRPCGSVLAGRLSATGSDTVNSAGTVARPFAIAGLASVMALRLTPLLEISARAGAGITLVRDSFEFVPIVFHTAAPVTVFASLGVGLRSR